MKPNITAAAAFARTWLPLSNALRRLFSIALLLAVSPASVNAQLKLTEEQQAAARERPRAHEGDL